jgi:hypothetical protein
MKRFAVLSVAACAMLWAAAAVRAQSGPTTDVAAGTQVRITMTSSLSTRVAHDGDPFTAIVAEPVFSGNRLLLPAGAKIHGTLRGVERPRWFSTFRGGASINVYFNTVEIESRIFPVRMSIVSIYDGTTDAGKRRKDVKTVEGVVLEENRDIKRDVEDVAIGTAGGSTLGLIFSRVVRGTVLGLVGSGAYIAARKGKDVEIPAQTGMIVRLDSTLSLPGSLLHNASYTSGGN